MQIFAISKINFLAWTKDKVNKYLTPNYGANYVPFLFALYSEVPNRRACSLRFFRFSFHPARNTSCNKQKIPPCSFINLLSKKAGRVEFFPSPARLFRSALLLGTSEYLGLVIFIFCYQTVPGTTALFWTP